MPVLISTFNSREGQHRINHCSVVIDSVFVTSEKTTFLGVANKNKEVIHVAYTSVPRTLLEEAKRERAALSSTIGSAGYIYDAYNFDVKER